METNPDLLNPQLCQCFPLFISCSHPQHTLKKERNVSNSIKERKKDVMVHKQI